MLTSRRYYIHFFLPYSSLPTSFLPFPSFLLFFLMFLLLFQYTELLCSHFSLLALLLFPFLFFFSPYFFAFPFPPFIFSSPLLSFSFCFFSLFLYEWKIWNWNKKAKGAQSQGFNVTLYSGGWQRSNSRCQETRLPSIAVRRAMPYSNT